MDGILYEDGDILVCRKAAGIPVESADIRRKDMVSLLNGYLAENRSLPRESGRPAEKEKGIYVVHRLDQPVEGVMVFAKTRRAAAELSRQAAEGGMEKVYRAVCCWEKGKPGDGSEKRQVLPGADPLERIGFTGEDLALSRRQFPGHETVLEDDLVKDGRTNTSRIASKEEKGAKRARLRFRLLDIREQSPGRGYALAEIHLETGRHHQIRVQMAHAGLPLYGDQKYNREMESFRLPGEDRPSLALCAVFLAFRHPVTGKRMTFSTEPENRAFMACIG